MTAAHDLARVTAGEVRRIEFHLTDEDLVGLSPVALRARQAELVSIRAIACQLGLVISEYYDPMRMTNVLVIARSEV